MNTMCVPKRPRSRGSVLHWVFGRLISALSLHKLCVNCIQLVQQPRQGVLAGLEDDVLGGQQRATWHHHARGLVRAPRRVLARRVEYKSYK
jgi:hypothetical protein